MPTSEVAKSPTCRHFEGWPGCEVPTLTGPVFDVGVFESVEVVDVSEFARCPRSEIREVLRGAELGQ